MTRLWAACIIAVAASVSPSGTSPAHAQGFPSKTIRIIVPFTPGGSNDVVAREIASGLQDSLKQTAVVENKPGGGGAGPQNKDGG
jgi:tripartite-type tricarboxylate transporter receptor subunit TctC